jgi:formiminoglutamase/agmatinase
MTDDEAWRFTGWTGRSTDPNDEQFGDVVEETSLDDADACDVVLLGEPFDGAVLGRRGARYGPGAIRTALAGLKTARLDGERVGSVGDLGDERAASVVHFHATDGVADLQERLCDVTADIHALDAFPVFLGGDNSLTYANVEPLLERDVGVVNFDAHLDVREVRGAPTSGTPYRQLLDAGLDGYAVVGARHFETAAPYVDYVREQGGEIVDAEAVAADVDGALDRALDALEAVEALYVSVDLDVLDATAAPGVSAPTPGGITTGALFRMLRRIATDDRLAGFEVVECAPPLDRDGRTVDAAARAVAHVLGGLAAGGDRV